MTARSGFFAPLLSAFMLATAACGSAPPGESTGSTANAIDTSTIVSRAMELVDAGLHYCQSSQGNVDGDSSCWAWEGAGHVCHRQSNAEWNAYRSDCSGFVTWSWGLPPVGDGGYITSEFAPYDNSFSHTIDGAQLQPGDALNKTPDEHIVLFKQWVVQGQTAIFMEEPGCSVSTPYAHEFTSNVSISGPEVYIDYEGATFYAIRYDGVGGGGGTASNACSFGDGYCTATMQCDAGQWVPRQTDSDACTSGPGVSGAGGGGASSNACSYGNGYCTNTMQCDNGQWVTRQDDASACTSGPGATSGSGNSCSYGDGYCTATEQCDSGHWVPRQDDSAACTSGPAAPTPSAGVSDACSGGQGYCTETLQCDNSHWIVRSDDTHACTTVVNASEPCSGGDGYCTATLQCQSGRWVPRSSDASACTSGPGA
jgi:hypothetical protein